MTTGDGVMAEISTLGFTNLVWERSMSASMSAFPDGHLTC
jgi:hypothetical protein